MSANWVRWRRGATLLARVIIFSSRKFVKRDHEFSVIFRKNPTFAAVCGGSAFGFSSAALFLKALLYRKRGIHLFRQRPLFAANRGLVPQIAICGNASDYFEVIYRADTPPVLGYGAIAPYQP